MNKEDAQTKYNPIFMIDENTEARQMWFVGSNQRDVMGMLYKDEQGWVLKYRFRHYAEAITNWDDHGMIGETAFDNRDRKSVMEARLKKGQDTEEDLDKIALNFTQAMESLTGVMKEYDPQAYLWTKRVSTGTDIFDILKAAPWAYTRKVPND